MTDNQARAGKPGTGVSTSAAPPLLSLYLYVSGSCNLACKHCWVQPAEETGETRASRAHLPIPMAEKAIKQAVPLGLTSVKVTGGEPLLHPEFHRLLDLFDDFDLDAHIETNGTLIDAETAAALKRHPKVKSISVSLDGASAGVHDALRGKRGSHGRALEGIKHLAAQGLAPQLICTLHRGNASEVHELPALARRMGCQSVKFNHLHAAGQGAGFAEANGLGVRELIDLYRKVEKELSPLFDIPIHFDIPPAFHPIRRLLKDSSKRCNIQNILGILATGEVSLCGIGATVPDLVLGRLEDDDLGTLWSQSPLLKELRRKIPAGLEGICGVCLHREACQGFCAAANYLTGGSLQAPYAFCRKADEEGLFPNHRTIQHPPAREAADPETAAGSRKG